MTREELRAMGVTEEQIEKIMASHAKDIQAANSRTEKYKADADSAVELKKQLDELTAQNMTEVERANKKAADAEGLVAELQKQMKSMKLKTDLAEKGIVGENADKLIESLAGGTLDIEVLGQIISARESAAATAKEQEIANKGGNPGSAVEKTEPEKSSAEKVAETVGQVIGGINKSSADVLAHYTN